MTGDRRPAVGGWLPSGAGAKRFARGVAIAAWLVAVVVTWNGVFDAHVVAGARDYVDRQALFVEGRGPRADMDAMMRAAVSSGGRAATGDALLVLAPGLVLVAIRRKQG